MKLFPKIEQFYKQNGRAYEFVFTQEEGHAEELARMASLNGATNVIAVGGDGTLFEVLNGNMQGGNVTLGVLPTGTGNDFARALGYSVDLNVALQQFKSARVRPMDVGKDVDGLFGNLCGVGFVADVMNYVNSHRGGIFKGPLAIGAAVVSCVRQLSPTPMIITIDDEVIEMQATMVSVHNTNVCGGGMLLAPDADPYDGQLDLFVAGDVSRIELLKLLPKVYSGGHRNHPAVMFKRGRKISVHSERPLVKMFDGNIKGNTPIEVEVLPHAVQVLAAGC